MHIKPHKHQLQACKAVVDAFYKTDFITSKSGLRHKVIMPCGSGKTFTALMILKKLLPDNVLIAVPTLLLRDQIIEVFHAHLGTKYKFLSVGTRSPLNADNEDMETRIDTGIIEDFYKTNSNNKTITVSTYNSIEALCDISKRIGIIYDLGILDEAHRTAIGKVSPFSKILFNDYIHIRHRLFMTATERIYNTNNDDVFDMSSQNHYGETAFSYSIKQAIDDGVLNNYKVATIFSTHDGVRDFINNNQSIKDISDDFTDNECAQLVGALMCVIKAVNEGKCSKIISYHNNVRKAKLFSRLITEYANGISSFHINGIDMPYAKKQAQLAEFKACNKPAVLTNSKALVEGIDIPQVDAVIFVDKRESHINIIQAMGRCLRRYKGKPISHILLPVLVENEKDIKKDNSEFLMLYRVLMAIAISDQVFYASFIESGGHTQTIQSCFNYEIPDDIDFKDKLLSFMHKTELRILKRLRIFLPFDKANELIKQYQIKSGPEYRKMVRNKIVPSNFPLHPPSVYGGYGWNGWGNFLGYTNRKAGTGGTNFLSYNDCSEWARKNMLPLGINSGKKWRDIVKTLPSNVPGRPDSYYKEWVSWPVFLGIPKSKWDSSSVFGKKLSYEDAKAWVQKYLVPMGITSISKYMAHADLLPDFLPKQPHSSYAQFKANDFFGNNNEKIKAKQYLPYEDAKKYVMENIIRPYGITNCKLWEKYCRGLVVGAPALPKNVPKSPNAVYKKRNNWKGWGDWFGTGVVASYKKHYWPYNKAKQWVANNLLPLGINTSIKWHCEYLKGKYEDAPPLPPEIPNFPPNAYAGSGWNGWGDWFGTGNKKSKSANDKKYLPYNEAKAWVQKYLVPHGVVNAKVWLNEYIKGRMPTAPKLPRNIPSSPQNSYRGKGWDGFQDFLGYTAINSPNKLHNRLPVAS